MASTAEDEGQLPLWAPDAPWSPNPNVLREIALRMQIMWMDECLVDMVSVLREIVWKHPYLPITPVAVASLARYRRRRPDGA